MGSSDHQPSETVDPVEQSTGASGYDAAMVTAFLEGGSPEYVPGQYAHELAQMAFNAHAELSAVRADTTGKLRDLDVLLTTTLPRLAAERDELGLENARLRDVLVRFPDGLELPDLVAQILTRYPDDPYAALLIVQLTSGFNAKVQHELSEARTRLATLEGRVESALAAAYGHDGEHSECAACEMVAIVKGDVQ